MNTSRRDPLIGTVPPTWYPAAVLRIGRVVRNGQETELGGRAEQVQLIANGDRGMAAQAFAS